MPRPPGVTEKMQAREETTELGPTLFPPQVPTGGTTLRVVSVFAACEELWQCQELENVVSWLQLLHHAILRDRLDAYDPSEAFLCLQGAALRFQAQQNKKDDNDAQENDDEPLSWAVWEESLWAAAALARVCVGPAWRMQLYQRRSWLNASAHLWQPHERPAPTTEMDTSNMEIADQTPTEVVTQHDASPRSYSPMTASSFGNLSGSRFDTWYPPIPEVLPAAMLRFAASVIETNALSLKRADSNVGDPARDVEHQQACLKRRKYIAEAQKELVLALCCTTSEEPCEAIPGGKHREWTIPGANEPVASMLFFWLETATTGWPSRKAVPPSAAQADETTVESAAETALNGVADDVSENEDSSARAADRSSFQEDKFPEESMSLSEPGSMKEHTSWSDVVDTGAVDWWYALQVSRAATDLVSNGWRPPLRSDVGAEIVSCLLDIAEKGILTQPSDLQCAPSATNREAREERLAVASSAAEAVSALAALGASGLLPQSTLSHTVTILCRILVITTISPKSISLIYPLGSTVQAEEQVEWELEKETFQTQRESCSADTADLLRVLLSHRSSAVMVVSTLMRLIDVDLSCNGPAFSCDSSQTQISVADNLPTTNMDDAAVAIRTIGGALWGERSEVSGVPSLRVFWLPVLDLFCKVGSSIHAVDNRTPSADSAFKVRDGNVGVESCRSLSRYCPSSLTVVLEIIIGFRGLVESELILGDGLLTPSEMDGIVLTLDQSVVPWLSRHGEIDTRDAFGGTKSATESIKLYKKLRAEIDALLVQLVEFLDRSTTLGSNFHLIMDDTCRRQLHLLLLRNAIPYLEPEKAAMLGLAVIRSWASVGFLSCGSAEWCPVASDILAHAFCVYSNRTLGYDGGYVHSPRVRLEALAAITHEEGDMDYDIPSEGVGEDSSLDSRKIFTASPFGLTKNMREQHLELIHESILPCIVSILEINKCLSDLNEMTYAILEVPAEFIPALRNTPTRNKHRVCNETGETEGSESSSTSDFGIEEFELRIYATQLLGRLFRSTTVEKHNRTVFLQMLCSVASMKERVDGSRSQTRLSKRRQHISINEALGRFSDDFYLALEALHQIEMCLCATFCTLPYAHQSVPLIIDSLCSIAETYGGLISTNENGEDQDIAISRRVGAITSLLPLCRLSMSHDQHLILMEKRVVAKHTEKILLHLQRQNRGGAVSDELERLEDMVDEPVIAPFVTVSTSDSLEEADDFSSSSTAQAAERTVVSLRPVVSVLISLLKPSVQVGEPDADHVASADVREVTARLRCTCFDALSNLILSGVTIGFQSDMAKAVESPLVSEGLPFVREEKISRCRAIAAFAEFTCAFGHRSMSDESIHIPYVVDASGDSPLDMLLHLCLSRDCAEVVIGCHGLNAVLSSLTVGRTFSQDGSMSIQAIFADILSKLKTVLELIAASEGETNLSDHSEEEGIDVLRNADTGSTMLAALLSLLYDMLSVTEEPGMSPMPEQQRRALYLCHDICSSTAPQLNWSERVVALRCAASLVGSITIEDVVESLSTLSDQEGGSNTVASVVDESHRRLPNLVLDLLANRHRHLLERGNASKTIGQPMSHEFFATETEHIDHFVVERKEKCSAGPNVAWMCGDSILTCRVGASSSRYRGWMEIVVRSPSSRERRMVRLLDKVSVVRPELTTSLWRSNEGESAEFPRMKAKMIEQSEAVSRALALIERCDSVLANIGLDNDVTTDKRQLTRSSKQGPDNDRDDQSHGVGGVAILPAHDENTNKSEARIVEDHQSDAHVFVGGKETVHRSAISSHAVPSIHNWLIALFGDSSNVMLIEDRLRLLGFSDELICMSPMGPKQEAQEGSIVCSTYSPIQRLQDGPKLSRALSILDRTATLHTHKISLLFAGHASVEDCGKESGVEWSFEEHLLRATHGSPDFLEFATGISDMVLTRHLKYYSGGLDTSNYASDGHYAAMWIEKEEVASGVPRTMVLFHLVTLMPSGLNNRKRHVGNDNVHIVYVEQGFSLQHENDSLFHAGDSREVHSDVMSGEFGFVTIFVVVLKQFDLVRVSFRIRSGLPENTKLALHSFIGTSVVSRSVAPAYVRRVAVLADLVCRSTMEDRLGLASNLEERRTQIREMARYVEP